jgi:hypothetical protein
MDLILEFIVRRMSYLWAGARFHITGSTVIIANGLSGELLVESDKLKLRFLCDRRQLMFDVQAPTDPKREWFSSDLVQWLITGDKAKSGLLDDSFAEFFGAHLEEVEAAFSAEQWAKTRQELRRLAKIRSRELFGG